MNNHSDKIRINFFGIGCNIIKGEFDDATWKRFFECSKQIRTEFNHAVFDPTFVEVLQSPLYKSLHDFGNVFRLSGLLYDKQSHIEIRINDRQKRKIYFQELFGEDTLFPVYQTSVQEIDHVTLVSHGSMIGVEKEIGTIASYKFQCIDFSLDKLFFVLNKVTLLDNIPLIILSKIAYNGKGLLKIYSDTLVKESFVLYDRSIKSAVA